MERTRNGAFSTRCSPIGANVVHRSRTSGERSTVFSGFCAPALRGATCPSDTVIGIRSLCASHAGASSACGMPHSKPWRVLGHQPTKEHAIDSTIVRVHQHAAGVKGGNQNQEALGRSRGGFSTKIHLRTNAKGYPLTFDVTGGEAHEVKGYDALMELHDINPDRLLGDKGYDSDDIRDDLAERGIEPVIPPRSNRKSPIEYDREAYKRRNLIERWVNRLKQFRRIATRYEKTARAYLSMLCIAAARLWIKTVNTA